MLNEFTKKIIRLVLGFRFPNIIFFASKLKKLSKSKNYGQKKQTCLPGGDELYCHAKLRPIKQAELLTFQNPRPKDDNLLDFLGPKGARLEKNPHVFPKFLGHGYGYKDVDSSHFCLGHSSKKAMSSLVISHFIVTCDSFAK